MDGPVQEAEVNDAEIEQEAWQYAELEEEIKKSG